jgi:tetratricopeptide (TPR) repeat protein
LQLARAVGDRALQPDTLTNLSVLALRQGDNTLALHHAQEALEISIAVQSPEFETAALCSLANAELAMGRHAAAAATFERAQAVALALDNAMQHDARAGLARVALAVGDGVTAMHQVEALLSHLSGGGTLAGTKAPCLIRLTCHQVLAQVGDRRANELISGAHAELQSLAATLPDAALRHSFLNNIPEHSAILVAWSDSTS